MRKNLLIPMLGALILGALVFVTWMAFKDWPPVKKSPASAAIPLHELEDLVYREPFNPKYQLEMARVQYRRFEESMKTDEKALSRSFTAYMAACFEAGTGDICGEAQLRYQDAMQLASMPEVPFDIFYDNAKPIFELTRGNVNRIVAVRDRFESVWRRWVDANGPHSELGRARMAVETYLRLLYEVEFGMRQVVGGVPSEESQFRFGSAFYDKWERGMLSYGQILPAHREPINDFQLKEAVDGLSAFDAGVQIASGESMGRFRLPNGDEILPGVRYFEDRGAAASQGGVSKIAAAPADTASPDLPAGRFDRPSDAYRHFRMLQSQGKWSEMYAMFEADSRKRMIDQTKMVLRSMLPDEKSRRNLDMMSGEDLFAVVQQNTTQHPIEIISEEVKGDSAVLGVRHQKADAEVVTKVHLVRVDGVWKMLWSSE